ncbi:MAG: VWA domain-containing protein [Calditrichaeota bacterium]|nr:VWA domain-containing protein [Calditrichota bacterium]MCB9368368.1 VWA domain-containing protein [Calditrichota bacterium]
MSLTLPLLAIRGVTFSSPAVLFLVFALVAVVLSVVVYRRTLPPVSPWRRRLLALIRAVALTLILFLIFEPVVKWLNRSEERAKILLLVDRSASMQIEDNGVVRDSTVNKFLRDARLTTLANDGELRSFVFGDSAIQTSFDSLRGWAPNMVGSDPANAWQVARSAAATEDVGAIVLVTDGAQNMGPNPEREAAQSSIPIYAVGVGDSTVRRDALIADLLTNDIAYKGTQVPVRVRVQAQGLAGQTTRLRIVDSKSRTLLDEQINLNGSVFEKTFETKFAAESEGELRVTAILDSVSGEVSQENNRRSQVIRILDAKYNVLVIAGSPVPDVSFVRQALDLDTTVSVSMYVETPNGFVGGKRFSEDDVRNAEMFVLVDYPTNSSNGALWNAASRRIVDGAPLLYLHGPNVSLSRLETIGARLPMDFQPQTAFDRVVLRDGGSHSALTARGPLPAAWSDLPPVLGATGRVVLKPAAVSVANFAMELTPDIPGGPAVAFLEMNRRRSVAVSVFEFYRWRLGLAKNPAASQFESELFSRLSAWLLAPTEEKQVKLSTDKKVYSTGEPVRVQGQVYAADLSPINDASVLVDVKSGDKTELLSLQGKGNGLYEAQFSAWGSGDYTYSGYAVVRDDTLGRDKGSFVVEKFNLEWLDARARWDVLQGIARNSGGTFVSAARPDSLFNRLSMPTKIVETTREIPLWNRPLFLWILIGLLAVEWLLRKRSGML